MKLIFTTAIILALTATFFAQKPGEILATATNFNFTSASLTEEGRKLFENQKTVVADTRTNLFLQMQNDILLETEAKAQNIPVEKLLAAEIKKIPAPTEAEIKTVYDANRAGLGDLTLEESRKQIVEFLQRSSGQKAAQKLIESLKTKYKFAAGKDVNAADLKPADILFGINGKSVSAGEFEEKNKVAINDVLAEIADVIKSDLENSVFSTLVTEEAKIRGIDSGSLIAAEVTNKLREFSDTERADIESGFQKKLFTKFNVKFLLKDVDPIAQDISAGDSPSQGKTAALVNVIMFSDFQCPACSATHPILKNVLAEYGDKVRFTVRNFPLTTIHENAFQSALAAGAANAQGKFFEYIDVLYRSQNALDKASLTKYAADLGLNVKQFEIDLASEKTAAGIRKDVADGKGYGITGTPTIFVNGVKVRHLSAEGFRNAIDKVLQK